VALMASQVQIKRRYCPNCGRQMMPGVIANLPPRPYWVCPACHQAEPES
jgi:ribosomal protein S27AE